MDLISTIVNVLKLYDDKTKAEMLKNVVVVGGASKLPGLKQRL
jgi:actin-related protein